MCQRYQGGRPYFRFGQRVGCRCRGAILTKVLAVLLLVGSKTLHEHQVRRQPLFYCKCIIVL